MQECVLDNQDCTQNWGKQSLNTKEDINNFRKEL